MKRRHLISGAAALAASAGLSKLSRAAQLPPTILGTTSGTVFPGDNMLAANYVLNANPVYLRRTRAALARVRAQTGSARLLFVGDSTTYGAYASATTSQARIHAFPTVLGQMLTGAGLPAADNNLIGLGVSTLENARDNDPRFSIGSGGFFATHPTAGAQLLMLTTATTPSVFTPGGTNAGFKVWYSTNGGNGTFSVAVNGGAATNVNTNFGSVALASQTFSASQGANTISLNWVSGGPCYVVAIEAIDPSTGVVHIMNAGWSGSRVTDWNDSSFPWSPLLMIAALTPDVTFIDLGINDWVNSESVATYTTGLQAIISAAKAVGDCVVVTPAPSAITRTTAATQAQYTAAARTLALSNGCVIIDGSARWGSYEITNPLGLYANTLHPNGTGYAEWAKPYFSLLMNE